MATPDEIKARITEAAHEGATTAKEALANLKEEVAAKAEDASAMLKDASSTLKESALQAADTVVHQRDETLHKVGKGVADAGAELGKRAPKEGPWAEPLEALATTVQSAGKYLTDHLSKEVANDFASLVRQHPLKLVTASFAAGFLLATLTRSASAPKG